ASRRGRVGFVRGGARATVDEGLSYRLSWLVADGTNRSPLRGPSWSVAGAWLYRRPEFDNRAPLLGGAQRAIPCFGHRVREPQGGSRRRARYGRRAGGQRGDQHYSHRHGGGWRSRRLPTHRKPGSTRRERHGHVVLSRRPHRQGARIAERDRATSIAR